MSAFTVPPEASSSQRRASDPALSAWVAANAGSGKTFVLVRRVVRLLLAGTPPGAILCLTFTKAAAATMANRIFKELREWVQLDDAVLSEKLADIVGEPADEALRLRARRLFAEALDTPGGLKIQTIHAFCERLLHQFPFEANVPARFEVLDESGAREVLERAQRAVLDEAVNDPDGLIGRSLAVLSARAGDETLADLFAEALAQREALQALDGLSEDQMRARLSLALGLDPDDSLAAVEAALVAQALIPASEWASVGAEILHLQSGASDIKLGEGLIRCGANPAARSGDYVRLFVTAEDTPRKTLVVKKTAEALGPLAEKLRGEAERLAALLQRRKGVMLREGSLALQALGRAMLTRVEAEKARRGLLDFADLIALARRLLAKDGAVRWVLYKLDASIDHILVDEAQDTSPEQWDIVQSFVEEFTSGEGARPIRRTLFVVGDEKQSIYSFQGADPKKFETMRGEFQQRFRAALLPFETIRLLYSFRSTDTVLKSVDQVFTPPQNARGLVALDGRTAHKAARLGAPGLIEVWPVVAGEEAPPFEPFRPELDAPRPGDPRQRLAGTLASALSGWIGRKRLPGRKVPIRAGDVLILVRQRGPLFHAIIRALKAQGVRVAGADRLVLTDHIAVQDLLALGDVMLTPEDDLALAALLVSPLFGLSDDDLFPLCHGREGSVMAALADHHPVLHERLQALRARLAETTPGQFYAEILAREGGRKAFLQRLGAEAGDALDEFVSLALAHEQKHGPDLFGFLQAMRRSQADIKRDMDQTRDDVRVMTVHGAKGLEAPIVILADTLSAPSEAKRPKVMPVKVRTAQANSEEQHLVWLPASAQAVSALDDTRQDWITAQQEEHRRLLYVALTRAEDMLVVCGAGRAASDNWHTMVSGALGEPSRAVAQSEGEAPILQWGEPLQEVEAQAQAETEAVTLPDWALRKAPLPPAPVRALSPSLALDEEAPRSEGAVLARAQALRRGTLTHRLLQSLPDLPAGKRADAAERFLAAQEGLDPALAASIAADVLALMEDARLNGLFAPGSRAEVSVAGTVNGRPVNGQIDRLARLEGRLILADYKTNDPAPASLAEVPQAYLTQMALYAALAWQAAPGLAVEPWLIFTANGLVLPLPQGVLDAALVALPR